MYNTEIVKIHFLSAVFDSLIMNQSAAPDQIASLSYQDEPKTLLYITKYDNVFQ